MPKRRALYTAREQTVMDFNAPEPQPEPAPPTRADRVAETVAKEPQFGIAPGWIDTQKRTRTWNLLDTSGNKMAEITVKRDAQKLAYIFNRVRAANRRHSP